MSWQHFNPLTYLTGADQTLYTIIHENHHEITIHHTQNSACNVTSLVRSLGRSRLEGDTDGRPN